jgi:hypothetical protein
MLSSYFFKITGGTRQTTPRATSGLTGHELNILVFFFGFSGWPLIGLLYQSQTIDDDECGAVGGIRIGRGNRNTRRKPAPVPLLPQIPHDLTWARTRAAVVRNRRLTA